MRLLLLAAAGGALGAGVRHLVNVSVLALLGSGFPWATFMINIAGSLLMGVVVEALLPFSGTSVVAWRTFLATGILGGFTTFSAFSLDIWVLYERGEHLAVFLYVTLSVALAVAALILGMSFVRFIR
ncbi:MAG TPA: CrcB family protein [Hyphomicrobiaceae bacterium]|jgi:CrcB protein|nr:CrcB family protein [Hyphomicrobiaceae bacterium]